VLAPPRGEVTVAVILAGRLAGPQMTASIMTRRFWGHIFQPRLPLNGLIRASLDQELCQFRYDGVLQHVYHRALQRIVLLNGG
jgi:hypothetical protein